jgi:hypothetical protein
MRVVYFDVVVVRSFVLSLCAAASSSVALGHRYPYERKSN